MNLLSNEPAPPVYTHAELKVSSVSPFIFKETPVPRLCLVRGLAVVALGTATEYARAIYLRVEIEKVPVERLAKK